MSYRIGSLNMYKYKAYQSTDDIRKDLKKISTIIISERFDIVALQEIFNKSALDNLLKVLGPHWKGCWDSPNSKTAQAAEGYAFIWDTRRIELVKSITNSGECRTYYPRIYNQYRINKKENQRELVRNPFYARFKPINAYFEIRLINVHIMFRSSENEIHNLSDAEMRRKEYELLVKYIYAKEADKRYGNFMPAYTILLGDYNLNLKRDYTKPPYFNEYEVIEITDNQKINKRVIAVQDGLTTLKAKSIKTSEDESSGYANNYDHFSYDEIRFSDVNIVTTRVDSVSKYFNNDFDKYRKEVSDHIPIQLELELR